MDQLTENARYSDFEQNILDFPIGKSLTRDQAFDIFSYWNLGKNIVTSLSNYALSTGVEFDFGEDTPTEVLEEFGKVSKELNQMENVIKTLIFSRICGMSGIAVYSPDKDIKLSDDIPRDKMYNGIKFKVLDTLVLSGGKIDVNPSSFNFMEYVSHKISNKTIHKNRIHIAENTYPIYLQYSQSTYNFSGQSIFSSILNYIKIDIILNKALENVSKKAGAMVVSGNNAIKGPQDIKNITKAKEIIKQLNSGDVVMLDKDATATFYDISSASGLKELMVNNFANICQSLDVPVEILSNQPLGSTLNSGNANYKLVQNIVQGYREQAVRPIIDFTSKWVCKYAFSNDFCAYIKSIYKEKYAKLSYSQMRELWESKLTFSFNPLAILDKKEELEVEKMEIENEILKNNSKGSTSEGIDENNLKDKYKV